MNLILSAISVLKAVGHTDRSAATALIDSLNADLSASYTTNVLSKWRRAERPIPQPVQDWLLRVAIQWAIEQCGGVAPASDEALDRLAAMLCPPGQTRQSINRTRLNPSIHQPDKVEPVNPSTGQG